MKVEIYIGLGTQKKVIWQGDLDHVPRVGEDIVLGQDGYEVEFVHNILGRGDRKHASYVRVFVR